MSIENGKNRINSYVVAASEWERKKGSSNNVYMSQDFQEERYSISDDEEIIKKGKEHIQKIIIETLYKEHDLSDKDLIWLIDNIDNKGKKLLFEKSKSLRDKYYGNKVYLRGLIEFTNYCKRECRYCGINAYNKKAVRYRLTKEEILECCENGRKLGYSTFVLQGGEDPYFKDEVMVDIVKSIKKKYKGCAVTLSIGERSYESYKVLREAGVDRFLLRHETVNEELYRWLHPKSEFETRKNCLLNLKKLGYQTGAGFMVGLPWYTTKDYVGDLRFIKNLQAEMVGIGPYITHEDTSLKEYKSGDLETTILMLSLVRMLLPKVLLPATTALGTISKDGRKAGLDVGCNVIMPNLSPENHRKDYSLYNNKKSSGSESAQALKLIVEEIEKYGYKCDMSRGDSKMLESSI